jgi:NAD(P)-dependent dehydrogenase (short-subunit alcohol dehydrogenase family)
MHDIPSQDGRLAVVTGATSGIGFHTAKELARKGATGIMPAREMRKGKETAERIEAEVPKAQLYQTSKDRRFGRFAIPSIRGDSHVR